MPDGIFCTYAEIVRGLRLQVLIAQIQIYTIHVLDILIVQLLGRGSLETLTPRSPQAQFTNLQHSRKLWRQPRSEALVSGQSQTGRQIKRIQQRQFILQIDSLRIVGSLSSFHSHRSFQPVVTVVEPRTQPLLIGQRENAFQRDIRQSLVTLQLLVIRKIGIVVGEPPVHIAVRQRRIGIDIVIGVSLPVGIKGDDVCTA